MRELTTKTYKFTSDYACSDRRACTSNSAAVLEAERILARRSNIGETIVVSDDNGRNVGIAAWAKLTGVRVPQYKVVVTLC